MGMGDHVWPSFETLAALAPQDEAFETLAALAPQDEAFETRDLRSRSSG
ncbi:MAG: hypothetical protein JO289_20330 [Xanthobacteraceae bacterium]|nr:hypothetical protein [Xanthobacteraceae bacterium]